MNLHASLCAADLAAAEGWFTKLLGRGPDHRPMPTLLHWELSGEGGLMVSLRFAAQATLPARMSGADV